MSLVTQTRYEQPAGRRAAPGELAVVQAFINTANIEAGADELDDAVGLSTFLDRNGLFPRHGRVSAEDFQRARLLREALRALVGANNAIGLDQEAVAVLDEVAERAHLIATFDQAGAPREVVRAGGVDGALGELLAIVHRAIRDGSWSRLKACREHGCRWAFYDHSRNRSSTWCSMALCGTRAKMQTYRRRLRRQPPRGRRRRSQQ
jgi:predicted RNA-binding Zn ribbon-like protein